MIIMKKDKHTKRKKGKNTKQFSETGIVKFDPLQKYLAEVRQYELLTRDEERDVAIRYREENDPDAAYTLVTSNLRLVIKIALDFQRYWLQNLSDLIQEGNIGLMMAVKNFDPYKEVKFSYYASFWIKAYILKFIMDNWRLVKIGTTQAQRKLFFNLKKEKQKLIDQGFDPETKLLSENLGVPEKVVVEMEQRLDASELSIDAPLKNDSGVQQVEFLATPDEESAEDQLAKRQIETLLLDKLPEIRKILTKRELEIFDQRIFSETPLTLQEFGERYSISRERVRQIEQSIIKKIRNFLEEQLPDFDVYVD